MRWSGQRRGKRGRRRRKRRRRRRRRQPATRETKGFLRT
jgi:hypothetical protein